MGSGDLGEASAVLVDSVIRVFHVALTPAAASAAARSGFPEEDAWPLDLPEGAEGASGIRNVDRMGPNRRQWEKATGELNQGGTVIADRRRWSPDYRSILPRWMSLVRPSFPAPSQEHVGTRVLVSSGPKPGLEMAQEFATEFTTEFTAHRSRSGRRGGEARRGGSRRFSREC
jgi:hypothetical protein